MRYSLTLDSAPATAPVTTAEAKTFVRQDGNADDTLIDSLVAAATTEFQEATGRRLVTQTWIYRADRWTWDYGAIRLPLAPVASITHVKYYDGSGTLTTWDSALWQSDLYSVPALIMPAPQGVWPELQSDRLWSVEVKFVCGYGAASAVPDRIKTALKHIVADMYENREGQNGAGRTAARPVMLSERVNWFGA